MLASSSQKLVLIIAIVIGGVIIGSLTYSTIFRPKLEWAAIAGLRSLGNAQLGYQSGNDKKYYGTFSSLKVENIVAPEKELDNLIEYYDLNWKVHHPYPYPSPAGADLANNTYTIIAYPNPGLSFMLSTFAISEDLIVRRYISDADMNSIHTWSPVDYAF